MAGSDNPFLAQLPAANGATNPFRSPEDHEHHDHDPAVAEELQRAKTGEEIRGLNYSQKVCWFLFPGSRPADRMT